MELSKTAYVILGMLNLGRRTGYEIKSLVDVSTRFFWAASYGQIYPELARLEELGLLTGKPDSSNGRRRTAYELTPAGEDELHAWLTSVDPLRIEVRHEGALKFFFSDSLSRDEQLELLRHMREGHERAASELRSIEPVASQAAAESGRQSPYRTLQFGIAYQEFVAGWCRQAERELGRKQARAGRR